MRGASVSSRGDLSLWSTSACAALLMHLTLGALLFVHWEWRVPLPAGSSGAFNALDVDLPSAPAPRPAATTSSAANTASTAPPQLKPLDEMETLTSEPSPALVQPARAAASPAQTPPSVSAEALAPVEGFGEANAAPNSGWLAEVRDQLDRYKQYPASARRRHQQDTVRLQFSVNRAGQVTSFHIDSAHHYKALEQEVRRMLRLAAPFTAPPPDIPVDGLVIDQEVNFRIVSPLSPPLVSLCHRPAGPGPVPAGAASTLEQMRSYRDQLKQYLAATRSYLDCLALASAGDSPSAARATRRSAAQPPQPDRSAAGSPLTAADTTPEGSAAIAQLDAVVERFNAQAQLFRSAAEARALKAQQQAEQAATARLARARAAAAQAYAACAPPADSIRPRPITAVTADTLPAYRKRLVAYDTAVHAYVSCIDQARGTVLAQSGSGLTGAQRLELEVDAAKVGNAAVEPLNQLIAAFNTKLQSLQKQALAARAQELAQGRGLSQVIFPDSTWSLPSPLPSDECIRITRSARGYEAQLCRSSYPATALAAVGAGTESADATSSAMQAETIAAAHGVAGSGPGQAVLGIAVVPSSEASQQSISHPQTIAYSLSRVQVNGGRLALTIQWTSSGSAGEDNFNAIHLELALSQDEQSLRGRCSTQQRHWGCQLSRHP